ncbi:DUF4097 family beta strand repeat-containing protein [Actinosynnema sp. NPDC020468]|uniref:DUF4097 family beta strand repeat-containing protein n=1 Tax=Actinosynnema sp. NPDC020468 TaxID=3154488 RepID=UPI0033F3D320
MPEGAVVVNRVALWLVAGVAVAGSLTSCVRLVQQTARDESTVTDRITTIRVQNDSGEVTIRSADGVKDTVVRRVINYPKNADKPTDPTTRVEGSTLVLDGCDNQCSVSYDVTVPSADTKVTGDSSSGDVRVEGVASVELSISSGTATLRKVSGPVHLDAKSGDVVASDVSGAFTALVGSGTTTLTDMKGPVTVDGRSGDISVTMATAQNVKADASSGDVNVTVPQGKYHVRTDAGSGDNRVSVADDPNGTAEIVLDTKSGNVVLRTA